MPAGLVERAVGATGDRNIGVHGLVDIKAVTIQAKINPQVPS